MSADDPATIRQKGKTMAQPQDQPRRTLPPATPKQDQAFTPIVDTSPRPNRPSVPTDKHAENYLKQINDKLWWIVALMLFPYFVLFIIWGIGYNARQAGF